MSDFVVDKNKIARNTFVLYFRMAFTMVVSFFTTRVTLDVLGSEDYGLNNLVGGVVAMFSFINGSMGTAVQRFYSIAIGEGSVNKLKKVFGCGLYLHIVVAVITLLLAEIFACFFLHKLNIPVDRLGAAQVVFQLAMISMVLNIVNVPYTALLRAREEFSIIAFADIATAILRLIILFLLITFDYDKLVLFAIFNFAISLFNVLFLSFKAKKYEEAHTSICRDKYLIKEMIKFVSLLLFTVLAQILRDNGLTILVNLFFGLTLNAAFAIATQVSHMVSNFVMNFKQVLVPQMMSAWGAGNKSAVHSLINFGTKITFILMLMISIPIIFESEFILNIWLKNPPKYASTLVSLSIASINISSYTYFLYQAVHATGKIKGQQIAISLLFIFNIILIYGAYKFGFNFYYAYYITIVVSIIQCMVNIYYARKYVDLSIKDFFRNNILRSIIVVILIVCVCALIIGILESGWLRVVFLCMIEILLCLFLGYTIVLEKSERLKIMNLLQGFLRK